MSINSEASIAENPLLGVRCYFVADKKDGWLVFLKGDPLLKNLEE